MPKYYVASSSNNAEGPYSFEELEALYKEGKILSETFVCPEVCPEGGQEWLSFGRVYHLTKNTNRKEEEKETERQPKKRFVDILLDKSEKRREERLLKEKVPKGNLIESKKESILEKDLLEIKITIEGIFRLVGVISLIAGIVLLYSTLDDRMPVLGFIYLISGAFSCLVCFWFAKVLTLLQKIADKK